MDLIGPQKNVTQSNLNLKIGEVKAQVLQCTFKPYDFVISIDKL